MFFISKIWCLLKSFGEFLVHDAQEEMRITNADPKAAKILYPGED